MFTPIGVPELDPKHSGITAFNLRARPQVESARWRGNLNKLVASVTKHSWRLLWLKECVSDEMVYAAHIARTEAIELDLIEGSINRSDDFDRNFYPLHNRLETRWVRIASMMLQGTPLPPIDLIRVGKLYFVSDGHHRVSVARMLNCVTIDAVVHASYD